MARVLFVCLHNAGRSQMSEALFARAVGGRHEARSAGTDPRRARPPRGGRGDGRAGNRPQRRRAAASSTDEDAEWADVVVTMGCGDECPYIPGKRYLDWDLPDPKGRPLEEVRATRDEIAAPRHRAARRAGGVGRLARAAEATHHTEHRLDIPAHGEGRNRTGDTTIFSDTSRAVEVPANGLNIRFAVLPVIRHYRRIRADSGLHGPLQPPPTWPAL